MVLNYRYLSGSRVSPVQNIVPDGIVEQFRLLRYQTLIVAG